MIAVCAHVIASDEDVDELPFVQVVNLGMLLDSSDEVVSLAGKVNSLGAGNSSVEVRLVPDIGGSGSDRVSEEVGVELLEDVSERDVLFESLVSSDGEGQSSVLDENGYGIVLVGSGSVGSSKRISESSNVFYIGETDRVSGGGNGLGFLHDFGITLEVGISEITEGRGRDHEKRSENYGSHLCEQAVSLLDNPS